MRIDDIKKIAAISVIGVTGCFWIGSLVSSTIVVADMTEEAILVTVEDGILSETEDTLIADSGVVRQTLAALKTHAIHHQISFDTDLALAFQAQHS